MSPPNWLPPLNFHDEYQVSAVASQLEFPLSDPSQSSSQPNFQIRTHVLVFFYPDDSTGNSREKFRGLSLRREISLPCYKLTSPPFFQETVSNLLDEMLVPFGLARGVSWLEKHLNDDGKLVSVSDSCDLAAKIRDFACGMRAQWYNAGHNVLPMNLSIIKMVKIPCFQFVDWRSWYDDKLRSDPGFGKDFEDAISRPRSEQELLCGINPELDETAKLGGKMMGMTLS